MMKLVSIEHAKYQLTSTISAIIKSIIIIVLWFSLNFAGQNKWKNNYGRLETNLVFMPSDFTAGIFLATFDPILLFLSFRNHPCMVAILSTMSSTSV